MEVLRRKIYKSQMILILKSNIIKIKIIFFSLRKWNQNTKIKNLNLMKFKKIL